MRAFLGRRALALAGVAILAACAQADSPDTAEDTGATTMESSEAPEPRVTPPAAGGGSADVSLNGAAVSLSGIFPARLCGGPYMMGEGVAYQTQAGDWQITVASERRQAGEVPLNTPEGDVNVIVTANGPGIQFVRGPRNGGSLVISDDYRNATADLQLRSVVGADTARLVATFTCEPPA